VGGSSQDVDVSAALDADTDEVLRWQAFEREALALCDPLARMVGHKNITYHLGVSGGQLTRELSAAYENRLSLAVGLYLLRHTQHERLAQLVICDGAGYRLPEPQKRKLSFEERYRALEEECRSAGAAGQALLDAANRRARR
jgi:hypothetical protein